MRGIEGIAAGFPRQVADALGARAAALARGIDPEVRPADVARIAQHRAPLWHGVLSTQDARRARSLLREAIDGLDVRIQVNRSERGALRLLHEGGRFGNAYDAIDPVPWAKQGVDIVNGLPRRIQNERSLGMFGTGTTMYGTVHFADRTHAPMLDHSGIIRLRDVRLDTGVREYGMTSFVLGRRAVENATFLPADTGVLGGVRPLRAREHLEDVALEWMVRNFMLDEQPAGRAATFENVFDREVHPSQVAKDFHAILDLPRDRAVAALREHLTSDAVNTSYMEAQVRYADLDDVVGLNVTRLPSHQVPVADVAPYAATIDALSAAAAARGIPVRFSDEPLRAAREGVGWIRGADQRR